MPQMARMNTIKCEPHLHTVKMTINNTFKQENKQSIDLYLIIFLVLLV